MSITNRSLVLTFVVLLNIQLAAAATYTVTKIADTNDGVCDADCSFREAVAAANGTTNNDTVAFSALFNLSQVIVLGLGEIAIANNGSLTVQGPGAGLLTIDGNQLSRILITGANVVANVDGIRFTRGNGTGAVNSGRGGAIYNVGGTLVLSNSVLAANSAANGGAINNAASAGPSVPANLTIINCTLENNSATSSGSALQNFSTSTLHMRGTSVINNTTAATGIAGAFQANGTVTITNSTFSGNSAPAGTGGGVYFNGTSMIMTNTTITGNTSSVGGGGLHRTGTAATANVRNTIIAGNSGAAASPDAFGTITSQGNNLVGAVGTSTGWIASDIQNQAAFLSPLANNGGPTQTHALLAGSPAINFGNNCVLASSCTASNPPLNVTTDQRGQARPFGPNVDIGSFESDIALPATSTVSGRVMTSTGRGQARAVVTLTNGPITRTVLTSAFGYFTFFDVPTGSVYQIAPSSKFALYGPQTIAVSGDVTGMTFQPL